MSSGGILANSGFKSKNVSGGGKNYVAIGGELYDDADETERARLDALVMANTDIPLVVVKEPEANTALRAFLIERRKTEWKPTSDNITTTIPLNQKTTAAAPPPPPASATTAREVDTAPRAVGRPKLPPRATPRFTLPEDLAIWVTQQWRKVVPPDGVDWENQSEWLVAVLTQVRAEVEGGVRVIRRPEKK